MTKPWRSCEETVPELVAKRAKKDVGADDVRNEITAQWRESDSRLHRKVLSKFEMGITAAHAQSWQNVVKHDSI